MLQVQPLFAMSLALPERKRTRIEFVAAIWQGDVERKAGECSPAFRILFPYAVNMAGVQLKAWEQLVGLYTYRLRGEGGPWKLETAVLGRQGVGEGQLLRHGVMPITGLRGWGGRMEAHMDHACLMMRSHAHGETRVHSGELGLVQVGGGRRQRGGGDDDARSRSSAGSTESKSTGVGRPHKAHRTAPPSRLPTVPGVTPSTQVAYWLREQEAQPKWQQQAGTAEEEVVQLRKKPHDA